MTKRHLLGTISPPFLFSRTCISKHLLDKDITSSWRHAKLSKTKVELVSPFSLTNICHILYFWPWSKASPIDSVSQKRKHAFIHTRLREARWASFPCFCSPRLWRNAPFLLSATFCRRSSLVSCWTTATFSVSHTNRLPHPQSSSIHATAARIILTLKAKEKDEKEKGKEEKKKKEERKKETRKTGRKRQRWGDTENKTWQTSPSGPPVAHRTKPRAFYLNQRGPLPSAFSLFRHLP